MGVSGLDALAAALRAAPALRMIIVCRAIPTATAGFGRAARPPMAGHQQPGPRRRVAGGRVRPGERAWDADLRPRHAIVIDDVWAMVGSANLNRRSWTHDSEVACVVLDQERDSPPVDPGGLGDGARVFAQNSGSGCGGRTAANATAERAGWSTRSQASSSWRATAPRLEGWHDGGNRGPGPPGRVRPHQVSWRRPSRHGGRRRCTGWRSTPMADLCRCAAILAMGVAGLAPYSVLGPLLPVQTWRGCRGRAVAPRPGPSGW